MSNIKAREERPMTQGFQHQNQSAGLAAPLKTCASPQHGQKADEAAVKLKEKRSFQPRPGH